MWSFVPVATEVSVPAACCVVLFLRRIRGLAGYFLLGSAFQVVLSLPAGIFQGLTGRSGSTFAGQADIVRVICSLKGLHDRQ